MQSTQFKTSDDTASLPVGYPQDNSPELESTNKGKTLEIIAQKAGVSRELPPSNMTLSSVKALKNKKPKLQKVRQVLRKSISKFKMLSVLKKNKATKWLRGFWTL